MARVGSEKSKSFTKLASKLPLINVSWNFLPQNGFHLQLTRFENKKSKKHQLVDTKREIKSTINS